MLERLAFAAASGPHFVAVLFWKVASARPPSGEAAGRDFSCKLCRKLSHNHSQTLWCSQGTSQTTGSMILTRGLSLVSVSGYTCQVGADHDHSSLVYVWSLLKHCVRACARVCASSATAEFVSVREWLTIAPFPFSSGDRCCASFGKHAPWQDFHGLSILRLGAAGGSDRKFTFAVSINQDLFFSSYLIMIAATISVIHVIAT